MRILGLIFFLCLSFGIIADPVSDIARTRNCIYKAIESIAVNDSLYEVLENENLSHPLMIGYKGTVQALKAKHAWSPYTKIKYLVYAERTFKKAILKDPTNMELRFMRFSVEHNCPGFIGFSKNIEADKTMIIRQLLLKNYGYADKVLVNKIVLYMNNSNRLTAQEIKLLSQSLS